jgi:hypothetical protein
VHRLGQPDMAQSSAPALLLELDSIQTRPDLPRVSKIR